MTPDQIINEIWKLNLWQVCKIALYDDFILAIKLWPLYVFLIVDVLLYALYFTLKK